MAYRLLRSKSRGGGILLMFLWARSDDLTLAMLLLQVFVWVPVVTWEGGGGAQKGQARFGI